MEVFLKGMWIGGTMTVPGVSGGTMAILIGIYDRLIGAVSGLVPKKRSAGDKGMQTTSYWSVAGLNILFLTTFLLGAGIGMLAFAKLISGLLEQPAAGGYLRFFFLGAVAGGIPLILSSAKVKKFSVWLVLLPVVGAVLVYALTFLPEEMFSLESAGGVGAFLLKLAGGIILAVALVLPGVSASQMLYTLGIYEELLSYIGEFRVVPLIPLGIGTVLGILFITKTLDTLMTRYPKQTFLIIFGFVLGSLPELVPQNAEGNSVLCGLCVAVGFLLAYAIGKRERNKEV